MGDSCQCFSVIIRSQDPDEAGLQLIQPCVMFSLPDVLIGLGVNPFNEYILSKHGIMSITLY